MFIKADDIEIERAISFLDKTLEKSKKNEKPVLMHSIRVGMQLYTLGYSKKVVIGALLHDLLEDSDVNAVELEQNFGDRVLALIKNCTFDPNITDSKERYHASYQMALEDGVESLVVRAADLIDNSHYYLLAASSEAFT